MTTSEILAVGRAAKANADRNYLKAHPELVKPARESVRAEYEALLEQANAGIVNLQNQLAVVTAERDQWRKQALEENAVADLKTVGDDKPRRGRRKAK